MASFKFVFLFLALFVATQCAFASPRSKRDTATTPEQPTGDAIANIQNFLKENLQFDKVLDTLKTFGEKVQTGTKDFAEQVQNKAQEIFRPATSDAPASR